MPKPEVRERRQLRWKLVVLVILLATAAVLLARGVDLRGLLDRGLEDLRRAGPLAFFAAMALLPAAGFPFMAFSLTAGAAFGPSMGMGWVVVAGLAALTINIMLTYWLASRALRPLLIRLLVRLGYKIPVVEQADMTDLIVILRVTPGPPFFVQNYLLGLALAPFGRYLLISCAVAWSYTVALIYFGDALLRGKGRMGLIAVSVVIALAALTHLVRRHYGRKRKES